MLTLATLHHLIDLRARARSAVTLGDQLVLGQHAAEQIGPHADELLAIAAALERIRTLCRYPSTAPVGRSATIQRCHVTVTGPDGKAIVDEVTL